MKDSKIQWCHSTFNPWRGCTKVSPGCANCYAEKQSRRNPKVLGVWGDQGTRVIAAESYWRMPLTWNREAAAAGERHRVFCASLADVFEDRPELVAPRVRLFHLIQETPHLDWLLLTKRPENVIRFRGGDGVPRSWPENMPPNVWLGTSVEDQKRADERIPHLLQVPARVRFLSCEPLLGPVDLTRLCHGKVNSLTGDLCSNGGEWLEQGPSVSWVIAGGESGAGARECNIGWIRSLRDQCQAAGVAFFCKQLGRAPYVDHSPPGVAAIAAKYGVGPLVAEFLALKDPKGGSPEEWPDDLRIREVPSSPGG